MLTLTQFLKTYPVNEHLIDSAPQMIFIMGLPAAGKSTFINKSLPKYFPSIKGTKHTGGKGFEFKSSVRTLDSDIQLHKRQKESAMQFCKAIYTAKTVDDFETIKNEYTNLFNSSSAQAMLGITFSISTTWDWVESHRDLSFNRFQKEFIKEFFKKDWAVNFAVRPVAKQDYKELVKTKLSPDEYAGLETFNENDVVIPVCGDELDKFTSLIAGSKGSYAVSIVYLDIPVEMSIRSDEERRQKEGRGVGRELIESKADGISKVWKYLSHGGFKKEGIYKMFHFKYQEVPGEWGKYNLEKEYVNTQMIKDFLPNK